MESRKAHKGHIARVVTEDYKPRNVPLTETHDLIRCNCGFFGWLTKELDPEPWVDYWTRNAEQWAPGDVFNPRPQYSQTRADYK